MTPTRHIGPVSTAREGNLPMADLPDGMLGPAPPESEARLLPATGVEAQRSPRAQYNGQAGSPAEAQPAGGNFDSPVRGMLVTRAGAEDSGSALQAAAVGSVTPPVHSKLTTEGRKRADGVRDKVRSKAERIENECLNVPNYDLAGPKPEGVSERRWRILKAANSNMKATPFWLTVAHKIADGCRKVDAQLPSAPTINAQFVQVNVVQSNDMPVRRIKD